MKIHISKTSDVLIGALRVNKHVAERLEELAKKNGVSKQVVIRAILDQVIDEIE